MTDLTAADLAVASPSSSSVYCVPDSGPLHCLPRNGECFTGIDQNGNRTRVWFERGQVLSEGPIDVRWWQRQQ
jgi:hypothetical protein